MDKAKKFLNIGGMNKSLTKFLEEGIQEITCLRYSQGLESLKRCESKLEVLVNQGVCIDKDIILPTLHNIALCYQSMGDLQECSAYLEACIYNIKNRSEGNTTNSASISVRIRKNRYLCLLYIQISDCFSRLNQQKEALDYARLSFKQCTRTIKLCLNALLTSNTKPKISTLVSNKKNNKQADYLNSINILQSLYSKMQGKRYKIGETDNKMRSLLGVQQIPDWIFTLTLKKITEIKPLNISDFKAPHSLKMELSKDFMLDKICMCATSCYLVSRELLRLNENPEKAKAFHEQAIAISTSFFPTSCPFLENLLEDYSEKFSKHAGKVKRSKGSTRCTSAKESRTIYQPHENQARLSTPKKYQINTKQIIQKIYSARNKEQKTEVDKGSHTQSEPVIPKTAFTSPQAFEKTEPEPPISEESEEEAAVPNFIICSKDLYGNYSEEEFDKYEYMPLKRDLS